VRFASGKYSDKSVALEPLAAAWAASPAKDPALAGIRVSVAIKGTPPAALPSDVFAPISDWRWEARAEGEGRLPWGFDANNSSADFRAKVAVVRACSEVGGGGHLLGVHDALACRKVSDGAVGPSCGPQTASQLAGVLMNPAVDGILKRAPTAPCAAHVLHVPTPDARDKVPVAPTAVAQRVTIDGRVSLDQACAEAILPFDLAPTTLVTEIQAKLAVCKSPLLVFLQRAASRTDGSAREFSAASLHIKGKKVSKLYAWHLLHKFAMALGRSSLAQLGESGLKDGGVTRVPLVQVIVEPAPSIPN
jgi:hypothetical protein